MENVTSEYYYLNFAYQIDWEICFETNPKEVQGNLALDLKSRIN